MCVDGGSICVAASDGFYAATEGSSTFTQVSSWTSVPGSGNHYMACHARRFVVPSSSCTVSTSSDGGQTWTNHNLSCINTVSSVAFTRTRFVAATDAGKIFESEDTMAWTLA